MKMDDGETDDEVEDGALFVSFIHRSGGHTLMDPDRRRRRMTDERPIEDEGRLSGSDVGLL